MTASPLIQPREAPTSLSKSIEHAMGCERFFVMRYLYDQPRISSGPSASRIFNAYRREYIKHLRQEEKAADPMWVRDWVRGTTMPEDIMDLITTDAEDFKISVDHFYAAGLFLGLNRDHELVERVENASPGRVPADESIRWHGTLDYVELDGTSARVIITTTGWTDANIKDYEGTHYAGLLFAALPYLTDIDFSYSFARSKTTTIPVAYNRQMNYHWIKETMQRRYAAMIQLISIFRNDGPISANPTAGLCKHCMYTCPVRAAVDKGLMIDKPLQTDRDAVELARRVLSANLYVINGRKMLAQYLEEGRALSLGNGLVAEMHAGAQMEYRLDKVMEVLGVSVPENSREFDVPLDGLKVGSTALKTYAKAKKRGGMMEKLLTIARSKPTFKLHIGKPGATDEDE